MRYTYRPTKTIEDLTIRIYQSSAVIKILPASPERQQNIRRASTLKSSVFSARIEGNPLQVHDFDYTSLSSKNQHKLEVQNILTALNFIFSPRSPKQISVDLIKKLHSQILKNVGISPGQFRTEQTGIFNQAGVAVYLTPPPGDIQPRLRQLVDYANSDMSNYLIRSSIAHFWFEKIHPFEDGNGRVGRLLSQMMLDLQGKNFNGLLSFEEEIDRFRSDYYSLLSESTNDLTSFVEFFLECVALSAESCIEKLQQPEKDGVEESLLPRRREILEIIRDHQMVSFDQIQRRFLAVKSSTLRYDLNQLIKVGLVKKLGSTRGALYKPVMS